MRALFALFKSTTEISCVGRLAGQIGLTARTLRATLSGWGAPRHAVQANHIHQLRPCRRAGPGAWQADPLAVTGYLRPGAKGRKYEVWIDRLVPAGAVRNTEVETHLRACDIFILLGLRSLTGSEYIVDKEIPIVRERQRNGDGVHFDPLLRDWTSKAGGSLGAARDVGDAQRPCRIEPAAAPLARRGRGGATLEGSAERTRQGA
jgi:hypothetical protein